ncbi:MAG TPA: hypothetical protein VEJ67_10510 [Candidatus Cybelea sp.]|nr:hypothetical protein [Candidatus Cybelea sp.]
MSDKEKISRVEVYWHTVRYRTVVLYAIVITAIVLATTYLVFPEVSGNFLDRISGAIGPHPSGVAEISARQARFVNLEGKVQVKKANSVQWINADFQSTLDKGDLIQTGTEGLARVVFADGTTYTVKQDTLVTVEENLVSQDRATQVAVHISSGQVDLATAGKWEIPGSSAQVSFSDAVASLQENSRAAVSSDPETRQQAITITTGSAQLTRGNEHVDIGQHERVSFPTGGQITRTDVLAPPELVEPLNLAPVIVADPKHSPIHFSWKPVVMAREYELQASTTLTFAHLVVDKRSVTTSADISGFDAGDYFWRARAIDENSNISEPSDAFKFTLVAEGKEQEMRLDVDEPRLQGNVVEVIGHTEPGATLIINGERVADIEADGLFRYFTPPMQKGSHVLAITGQDRRGDTATKRVEVVVP